jgi:hypothetical protein
VNQLSDIILQLIKEKGLSSKDIKDVIAEQVYSAKSSDVEEVYYEAQRLERIFGSKYQRDNVTVDYNKKADEFGGYFMTIVMQVQLKVGYSGVVECLQALETCYYELQKDEQINMVPTISLYQRDSYKIEIELTFFELDIIFHEVYEVKKMQDVFSKTNREIDYLHKDIFKNDPQEVIDWLIEDLSIYNDKNNLDGRAVYSFTREELEIVWTGINICMQTQEDTPTYKFHLNIMNKLAPLLIEAGLT